MIPNIDQDTRSILETFGFDEATFDFLRTELREGRGGAARNRIAGRVEPPGPGDVDALPPVGSDARAGLHRIGEERIGKGQVGAVILAGGMATRFGGAVKAAVDAVDDLTFLELKLRDAQAVAARSGGRIPVYLMTSFATHEAVTELARSYSTDRCPVRTFPQFVSLRLTPDGEIFRGPDGRPSPYAPGHGDLPFALRRAGVLDEFRSAGGSLLYMSNVDNVTATIDAAIVGAHVEAEAQVTAEVVDKEPGDKGGAPARVDDRLQIVEAFRFPDGFDQDRIGVFNTNTFILDAQALDTDFELTWFAVTKKVDGKDVLQFERLVGELTAFLPTHFVRVERTGDDARFQPVKDPPELERRRNEIRQALKARGSL